MKFLKIVFPLLILLFSLYGSSAQGERHCVTEVFPNGAGSIQRGCFDTLTESVAFATNGRVSLPTDASRTEVIRHLKKQKPVTEGTTLTTATHNTSGIAPAYITYTFAMVFDDINYHGDTEILTTSLSTGCQGTQYHWEVTPEWNNRIESADGFLSCDNLWMWDSADGTGVWNPCTDPCPTYGSLNNKGSFMKIVD